MILSELQAYLNIPRDAAYVLVNSPVFRPARKIGQSWQIDEAALQRWIKNAIRKKDKYYDTEERKPSSER